jgi:lipopolysaccharide export system permease protein
MNRLMDRLILQEIVGPFLFSALLFTGLFFAAGELVRYVEFLQGGQSTLLVAQLMLLTVPGVVALTFPMAMLLAALLGFGRLSSDSEIVGLTAAGVSFGRIVTPVALFALMVSLVGLWFNNKIVPTASRQRNIIIDQFKKQGGNLNTSQALTFPLRDDQGNLTTLVHVEGGANLATGELTDISVEFWNKGKVVSVISAPRARWKIGTKEWSLSDFNSVTFSDDAPAFFKAQGLETREVELDTPTQLEALQGRPEDTDTSQLQARSRILRAGGNVREAREADVEVARRAALPFAALSFALIGAPLGVGPQRGGKGVGFGLSVLVTFAYWVLLQAASVLAKGGTIPANISLMLPNLLCIGVGLYLTRRVLR